MSRSEKSGEKIRMNQRPKANPKSRCTKWVQKKRKELLKEFGEKCMRCGEVNQLEFAHIKPTECIGLGRGSYRRIKDILQNKEAYILLDKGCHHLLDDGQIKFEDNKFNL